MTRHVRLAGVEVPIRRRPMAHRPRVYPSASQVARWLLIAVLCVAVLIAWSAVPEPDLMGLR